MFKKAHKKTYDRLNEKIQSPRKAAFKNLNPAFDKGQMEKMIEYDFQEEQLAKEQPKSPMPKVK